jgi:hypothetical protein
VPRTPRSLPPCRRAPGQGQGRSALGHCRGRTLVAGEFFRMPVTKQTQCRKLGDHGSELECSQVVVKRDLPSTGARAGRGGREESGTTKVVRHLSDWSFLVPQGEPGDVEGLGGPGLVAAGPLEDAGKPAGAWSDRTDSRLFLGTSPQGETARPREALLGCLVVKRGLPLRGDTNSESASSPTTSTWWEW